MMAEPKRRKPAAEREVDVLIVGAGLAGLSLARQLLLADPDRRILQLDRLAELPSPRQKVGEATVQVSGYYLAKVLELEEYLLQEHYMKYNLRFYWHTPGTTGDAYEHYSQSFIRTLSNIPTYQLDRNKLEGELLRVNREAPGYELAAPVADLEIDLAEGGEAAEGEAAQALHAFSFRVDGKPVAGRARWVVDSSGRWKVLAKRLALARPGSIRHGTSFAWVEGLIDLERLSPRSSREVRLAPEKRALGHIPTWLATNHFMGPGYWLWVIPLHGKTSIGLVFDSAMVSQREVSTPAKLIDWMCREFPLFARQLPGRKVLDHGGFRDFAYDCAQTISPGRWALSGEAGRFSDPLYSPGGDLIAIYNTLIVDAIDTPDPKQLAAKCRGYEQLMRAIYEAYVASYVVGYRAHGDQEAFTLKYVWELAIYFGFYVFPFLNDLFTERAFLPGFLSAFSRLGPLNRGLQELLVGFAEWKREQGEAVLTGAPVYFDFTELPALRRAEKTFYEVGLGPLEARAVLKEQLESLGELARFIAAHVAAAVVGDRRLLTNRAFVAGIELDRLSFDPEATARRWAECAEVPGAWEWSFDPEVARPLRGMESMHAEMAPAGMPSVEGAA